MKWVKFWVSRHFLENPLRKWPEILHDLGFLDILVMLCGFSSLWCPFDWNWSYLGFLGIIWRMCGSTCQGGGGGLFPTLCDKFCLLEVICHISRSQRQKNWWFWPELRVSEFVFWRMGHGRVAKRLAKTVGSEGCLYDSGVPGSTLASTSWSNSLIIGIYPAASAQRHVLVSFIQNSVTSVWIQRWLSGFYTKGRPLVKSNLICPLDKLSWQPSCPVFDINIQRNVCVSQGNGSLDNLPENLV